MVLAEFAPWILTAHDDLDGSIDVDLSGLIGRIDIVFSILNRSVDIYFTVLNSGIGIPRM